MIENFFHSAAKLKTITVSVSLLTFTFTLIDGMTTPKFVKNEWLLTELG